MLIFSSVSFTQRTFAANEEPSYFTSTDQSNWVYVLKDATIDPVSVFNPSQPDPVSEFHWFESPSVNVLKPDGN